MKSTTIKKTVLSIISQREYLIKHNLGAKNKSVCLLIISKLKKIIDFYGNKYSIQGWQKFITNNYNDLCYLIPANRSGESTKLKLNEILSL